MGVAEQVCLVTERAVFSAEDGLLGFGMMAAVQRRLDALVALCEEMTAIQSGYPGRSILKVMAGGQVRDEELASYTAVEVHRVAHRVTLTPDELFIACARFLQWAKTSNLQQVLVPPLEAWARAEWESAIQEQRFNLRSPASSVPAIREILGSAGTGLDFLGRLVISAEPAVHCRFDQSFRDFLLS